MISENGVLRNTFGFKQDVVMGDRSYRVRIVYPHITRVLRARRMRCVGHIALVGRGVVHTEYVVGETEVKRDLGRQRRRRKFNVRIDVNLLEPELFF